MKEICDYHKIHPDQTGVMNCDACNTCSECKKVYYNDFEESSTNDRCPYCGDIGVF